MEALLEREDAKKKAAKPAVKAKESKAAKHAVPAKPAKPAVKVPKAKAPLKKPAAVSGKKKVILGCSKCRYLKNGCTTCRTKLGLPPCKK